ncbi:MAG: preprotein translocase subunit SecE [Tissierellia bacterium]|nr:preprotein translocase subunit SecE [Tissierellia bacterium]
MSEPKVKDKKNRKFIRNVRAEMRKVVWPSKKELISYTSVVIAMSFATAILIYILDLIIHGVLRFIIG